MKGLHSPWVLVGVGGGIGAVLRYGVSLWLPGSPIPINFFVINVVGCFMIGIVMALSVEFSLVSNDVRMFGAVGILGGFTTFSTFIYGVFGLLKHHQLIDAYTYAVGSVVLGLVGVWAGIVLVRLWVKRRRDRAEKYSE